MRHMSMLDKQLVLLENLVKGTSKDTVNKDFEIGTYSILVKDEDNDKDLGYWVTIVYNKNDTTLGQEQQLVKEDGLNQTTDNIRGQNAERIVKRIYSILMKSQHKDIWCLLMKLFEEKYNILDVYLMISYCYMQTKDNDQKKREEQTILEVIYLLLSATNLEAEINLLIQNSNELNDLVNEDGKMVYPETDGYVISSN